VLLHHTSSQTGFQRKSDDYVPSHNCQVRLLRWGLIKEDIEELGTLRSCQAPNPFHHHVPE
jgi:hypothetical protein